ncbi:MAG: hypothetical protein WC637_08315 [Victivallales bacterium]|jgi:hypothetical protein
MRTVAMIALMVGVIIAVCGCSNLMQSVQDKQVNWDSQVYGFKVTSFDPVTGSMSPVGEFGFGSLNYRSVPIEKGQPFYAKYTVKSIWSSAPASETIIWVGRASDKGQLTFEAVPETMIKISADGIASNTAKLEIAPASP